MEITRKHFGTTADGEAIDRWVIDSWGKGSIASMEMIDFGATLSSINWGGREICLGMDTLEDYQAQGYYLGCTVGPFANRIANAAFEYGGKRYSLDANDGPNTLHGGSSGFGQRAWRAEPVKDPEGRFAGIEYRIGASDGEGGFPGNRTVSVRYLLVPGDNGDSFLIMHHRAESDAPTPVNLTNHAYWNLAGEETGHLKGHRIRIPGEHYVDVDSSGIPTGVLAESACGSGNMDLSDPTDIASRIYPRDLIDGLELEPLLPAGFDHCYQVSKNARAIPDLPETGEIGDIIGRLDPRLAAAADYTERGGSIGRCMDVYTSCPGVQFYTGNFLDVANGRNRAKFPPQSAFCLETQYYPDAPNHASFADCFIGPDKPFEEITVHHFYE